MKKYLLLFVSMLLFAVGCQPNTPPEVVLDDNSLTLSLPLLQTRVALGKEGDDNTYPVYWGKGDRVVVNGVASDEVGSDEDNKSTATFDFGTEELSYPYNVTYPYCALSTAEKSYVEIPAVQTYVKGTISPKSAPLCGYAEEGDNIGLNHLVAVLRIPVRAASEKAALKEVVVTSTSGNKLSGIFAVDCKNTTISATGSSKSSLTYTLPENFSLLGVEITDLFVVVPAGEIGDCTIEFVERSGDKMTTTWSPTEALSRGVVYEFKTIHYEKGATCELEVRDLSVLEFKKYASADEMKVMSFNVRTTLEESNPENSWDNRKEACVELIKDHMPTILGVQEAKYAHHWTYLKQQLAADYDGYGVSRDTGKESGDGETMGILYNRRIIEMIEGGTFWLSETPNTPSKGFGANYSRCATWGVFKHKSSGKKFCYINTHIDHQSELAQVEGMKLISNFFEKYKKDYPLFITADFNMRSDNVAFDPIESYMYNTRDVAPEELTDYNTTYNGYVTTKDVVIDHIYCSNYLKVVEYHTINEQYGGVNFVSDHYPIYAIVKLK